jgi:hypothetical protein
MSKKIRIVNLAGKMQCADKENLQEDAWKTKKACGR